MAVEVVYLHAVPSSDVGHVEICVAGVLLR